MSYGLSLRKDIGRSVEAVRDCYLIHRKDGASSIEIEDALDLTTRLWAWYCHHFYEDFSNAPMSFAQSIHDYASEIEENIQQNRLHDANTLAISLAELLGA